MEITELHQLAQSDPHEFERQLNELLAQNKQLQNIATAAVKDPLTGTYNFRGLEEMAPKLIASAKRGLESTSFIVLDVNCFKIINDVLGHEYGDNYLHFLVNTIRKDTRPSLFIFRRGGDEFVLISPQTERQAAEHMINRLHVRCAEDPFLQTLKANILQRAKENADVQGLVEHYFGPTWETLLKGDIVGSLSFGLAEFRGLEPWQQTLARADHQLIKNKLAARPDGVGRRY